MDGAGNDRGLLRDERPVSVGDVVLHFWHWRKLMLYTALGAFVVSSVVSLLLPLEYTAGAVVLPPNAGSGLPGMSMLADLPFGIDVSKLGLGIPLNADLDRYTSIVTSRRLRMALIEE